MRTTFIGISAIALTLTACSQEISDEADPPAGSQTTAVTEEASADAKAERETALPEENIAPVVAPSPPITYPTLPEISGSDAASDQPVGRASMPEFTYTHEYKFEVPSGDLGRVQDAHMAACDAMGPQQCRLANFRQDLNSVSGTVASLELYVATGKIRTLADQMASIARDLGGERVEANIVGTDTTHQLDQAQIQVKNNLIEKDRLQAIIDDRRSTAAARQSAKQQLASLNLRMNADQKRLDKVASQLGFTKMDVSYSSLSAFGPWMPYALIILLIAAIGGLIYRGQRVKSAQPAMAV